MMNRGKRVKAESTAIKVKSVDSSKHDLKSTDKTQPTAEQMRIAQIIDTKNEDPTLKEKIKQVMDATERSEDEVCTALHDCDNDPDRAVNLLLEGKQCQWMNIKKKKRAPGDKNSKETQPATNDDSDMEGEIEETERAVTAATLPEPRGRGQPRPLFNRGQERSWRGGKEVKDEKNSLSRGVNRSRPRMVNGPSRGRGVLPRGRGRGRQIFHKPIETWDSQGSNSHPAPPASQEDWDNEEYTGSLADSKVFTPSSSSGESPPQQESEHPNEVNPPESQEETSSHTLTFLSQFSGSSSQTKTSKCPVYHEATHFMREMTPTPPFSCNYGVMFDAAEQSLGGVGRGSYRAAGRGLIPAEVGRSCEDVRIPRTKGVRPRIPPPSKIPSSAVEMPPEAVGSGMDLLDFQFGALDFADASDNIEKSGPLSPIRRSPAADSPANSEKHTNQQIGNSDPSILISDPSFSPVRSTVPSTITSISELNSKVGSESVSSGLYQDTVVYQTSQFNKPPSHQQVTSFNSAYSSSQVTSSSGVYSNSNSNSNYSSSNNSYNSSYQQQYPNYNSYSSQNQALPMPPMQQHSSNSYQSGVGSQYGSSSVYGSSNSTNSYSSAPYQTYANNNQHSHKSNALAIVNSSKEFEAPSPSVNLTTMTQTSAINATQSLLSSTPTTSTSKATAMNNSISKGTVVAAANMPTGVPPIVGPQYIMSQSGVPYFQHPLYSYEELQLVSQQRLPHLPGAYYELGYPTTPTTREGVQYNLSDARYARADNNTSPVSNITQQGGTQAHQQPLMNPTAMHPAYAYFYGGSVIPGNFQYGAPTIYPVAATGTGSGHSSNSSVYGKGPTTYTGGYGGTYDAGQGTGGDYKGSSQVPKTQPPQTNPATSSDITMYTKSHGALSKVNSYEKQGYCPTPPPFTLGSQNSGIGPGGGYAQHLFIPAITPHHSTTLMHQPMHQDSGSSVSGRSQVGNQQNKVGNKPTYSPSTYWTQN